MFTSKGCACERMTMLNVSTSTLGLLLYISCKFYINRVACEVICIAKSLPLTTGMSSLWTRYSVSLHVFRWIVSVTWSFYNLPGFFSFFCLTFVFCHKAKCCHKHNKGQIKWFMWFSKKKKSRTFLNWVVHRFYLNRGILWYCSKGRCLALFVNNVNLSG